ncbi:PREDICTED: long-chain specific acyl-CoA dehydrogenase, mitochondrial [Gekko japonicus]|uniref:Long-chain specific acyl-CoA dehydrogenase, mitochondrial n=1 Tax=Gekko japonicus TaxID=146911 RepID=A0ABM1KTH0_GEKJA|nr:PREDICTED: long-chain specific acyl-CoA dehydrogenase, mitochondrial [Gekko japonicus]
MASWRRLASPALRGLAGLRGEGAAPGRYLHTENHDTARLETSSAKTLMDIGTRRIFSSDHDIFRQSVRKFFQEAVVPYHAEWEKAGQVSRELWEKAGQQGLLGVNIAEERGGIGGDLFSAAVVWEEHDLQGVRTFAKKDGSDWILNGSKDTAELFFEDVRLPASALLGHENKGFYYLMAELPQERLLIADMAIASCEFMFEETRNYVKQRKAFGKTIAHLQTVQHKLAELKTQVCVGRAFLDSCLQLHSAKRLDSATASMAKYWASELQNSVATQCVQLHGGWGYMWEYPIAKCFVDSRVQPIYGGTNEIMKELIARDIVSDK